MKPLIFVVMFYQRTRKEKKVYLYRLLIYDSPQCSSSEHEVWITPDLSSSLKCLSAWRPPTMISVKQNMRTQHMSPAANNVDFLLRSSWLTLADKNYWLRFIKYTLMIPSSSFEADLKCGENGCLILFDFIIAMSNCCDHLLLSTVSTMFRSSLSSPGEGVAECSRNSVHSQSGEIIRL